MMISVSAVIPTFNGTCYLVDAIKSVLAQTYQLLEIIVVDDGSLTEDVEKIVSPFFPKVTYIRQENAGPASARNHGISIAKGDVIAFLDDDDLWHPTKTAEQVKMLADNPQCALVYSYPELIDEKETLILNKAPTEFPSGRVYLDFVKRNRIATPSATLIRREIFKKIGFFDENKEYLCGEDYDLWLRIARNYEVMFCPGVFVSYRIRDSGISKNLHNALKGDFYVLHKLISCHVKNSKVSDKFYEAFDYNLYHTYRRFSYLYFYNNLNRSKAKSLMLSAISRHTYYSTFDDRAKCRGLSLALLRRYPYYLSDIVYLLIFSLPESIFTILRKTKQRLSAAVISLHLA